MIHISKRASEKFKESQQDSQAKLFRVFISGIGWGGPRMGLVLDEPTANDEKIEVQGISLIMVSEVANAIRAYGNLVIDYRNNWWNRGFQLSLSGQGGCWFCRNLELIKGSNRSALIFRAKQRNVPLHQAVPFLNGSRHKPHHASHQALSCDDRYPYHKCWGNNIIDSA